MEGLDQRLTSAMDSTQQCLVLAVGITVQGLLDTLELCQVSAPPCAPSVDSSWGRNTGLHIHRHRAWDLSLSGD